MSLASLGTKPQGTRYFEKPDWDVVRNRKIIAIGIPAYNEQRHELKRTLDSLSDCVGYKLIDQNYGGQLQYDPVTNMRLEGYYTTALIILDGLKATSESMQEYMEELFGAAFIQGPSDESKTDQGFATFIVERKPLPNGEKHTLVPNLHLYLLVKVDNRKKHNSHEASGLQVR
jgi:hypothetical protein